MAANRGTYTLLLELDTTLEREVGALGSHEFPAGTYAYTGSAFGPGGFARIERHRRIARGDAETRHWHIDSLLPVAELRAVYTAPGEAIECEVARSLPGDRVEGFGATDCECHSHLVYGPADAELPDALEQRYGPPSRPP